MEEQPKHATIVTRTPQADGSEIIDTKAYYEKLASHKEEREYRRKTSRKELLNNLFDCVKLILDNKTDELFIHIKTGPNREPSLITHRYPVLKENFGKRV